MNKQKEDWKEIDGYDGYYEISNMGRVMSHHGKGRFLKLNIESRTGKQRVSLCFNGVIKTHCIPSLVWDNFGKTERAAGKAEIFHINGILSDNKIDNLQLMAHRNIIAVSWEGRKTSSKYTGVYSHKESNNFWSMIFVNGKNKYLGSFETEREASGAYRKKVCEILKKEENIVLDKYTSENGDCTQENKE